MTKHMAAQLLVLFSLVQDSRVQGMCDYPLNYIILIAFLAILSGAETWMDIHLFAVEKHKWLKRVMKVDYGIPSHDTFRRVFGLFDEDQFERIVVNVLQNNLYSIRKKLRVVPKPTEIKQYCIDGKEENGTGRKYTAKSDDIIRNLQTLHVYDATDDICIYSRIINKKTNEIPVAQEFLRTTKLAGVVCTFDALHTQKATISIIVKKGGFYVGGLKGNQSSLLDDVRDCFTPDVLEELKKSDLHYVKTVEKAHSQVETREYFYLDAYDDPHRDMLWGKDTIRSFVLCRKTIVPTNPNEEPSTEDRYYISNLTDLSVISVAIRNHWSVENSLHWHLDYSFHEDDNSTMDSVAYRNLSQLSKYALHLLQLYKSAKPGLSINRARKSFAWNLEESLAELLTMFDDEAIAKAIRTEKKRQTKDKKA